MQRKTKTLMLCSSECEIRHLGYSTNGAPKEAKSYQLIAPESPSEQAIFKWDCNEANAPNGRLFTHQTRHEGDKVTKTRITN